MYYWHTKPQGGISPALLDLRELFQPSVRHVIAVRDDTSAQADAEGDDPKTGIKEPERHSQTSSSEPDPDLS